MTETSPAVLTLDKEDAARKAGSSGKPVLHTRSADRSARRDRRRGRRARRILGQGTEHHARLLEQAGRQRSSFTDGWLHTGDAARIDEEGFYYIVDRWKDMYISGGENVYPAEVENVLHQLAAIAEAAVIGIPERAVGRGRHGDRGGKARPHRLPQRKSMRIARPIWRASSARA